MPIDESFGIIVLLDALGVRTIDKEVTKNYLAELDRLKSKIVMMKEIAAGVMRTSISILADDVVSKFNFRFFGDTVLMIYSIPKESDADFIKIRLIPASLIVGMLICNGLEVGIPFRGALSIGSYYSNQERSVDLGPAITDAANWYDKSDIIGIMATPNTTNYLKALYKMTSQSSANDYESPAEGLILYNVPLSNKGSRDSGKSLKTYFINWPLLIPSLYAVNISDFLSWFYDKIKDMQIPPGAVTKYSNTETFVRKCAQFILDSK